MSCAASFPDAIDPNTTRQELDRFACRLSRLDLDVRSYRRTHTTHLDWSLAAFLVDENATILFKTVLDRCGIMSSTVRHWTGDKVSFGTSDVWFVVGAFDYSLGVDDEPNQTPAMDTKRFLTGLKALSKVQCEVLMTSPNGLLPADTSAVARHNYKLEMSDAQSRSSLLLSR